MGKSCLPPGAGCEVRRIWSIRLERDIAKDLLNGDGPPKQTGLITNNATDSPAKTGIRKYSHPAAEYNRQEMAGNGQWDKGQRELTFKRNGLGSGGLGHSQPQGLGPGLGRPGRH